LFPGLLELADSYCEKELKKQCEKLIWQSVTVSNVALLMTVASKYQTSVRRERGREGGEGEREGGRGGREVGGREGGREEGGGEGFQAQRTTAAASRLNLLIILFLRRLWKNSV
jgi:hypothetical protein